MEGWNGTEYFFLVKYAFSPLTFIEFWN